MLSSVGYAVSPAVFKPPQTAPFTSAGGCDDCGGNAELQQLRAQDARVRAALQESMSVASSRETITPNITYTVGPDGQLYASGGTITTSRRVTGDEAGIAGVAANDAALRSEEAEKSGSLETNFNPSFADLNGIRLSLSPLEFVQAFGEEFGDDITRAELRGIDASVRNHENLHFRAAGGLASPPNFEFSIGPDGELFAVGGSVAVSTSNFSSPEKAARDATTIAAAGTAPGDASAQDVQVVRSALANAASAFQQAQSLREPPAVNISA